MPEHPDEAIKWHRLAANQSTKRRSKLALKVESAMRSVDKLIGAYAAQETFAGPQYRSELQLTAPRSVKAQICWKSVGGMTGPAG
jgi:hypothetical protein